MNKKNDLRKKKKEKYLLRAPDVTYPGVVFFLNGREEQRFEI